LPRAHDAALGAMRAALYAAPPETPAERPSAQMRLAVHAMNATMLVIFAPVGLAAMAHGIVRGEDFRRSAQLMAVMGLFAAAFGSSAKAGGLPFL
jgi:hypothetical protein